MGLFSACSLPVSNRQEIVPLQAENEVRREQLNGTTEDLQVKDQQLREVSEALKDTQAKNKQLQKTNKALAAQVKKRGCPLLSVYGPFRRFVQC